ncbi:hypothetical protein GCM10009760_63300 [Kitasatospora kazusensis]|uniref:Major facilitator superfamily (MFS) profile domain-containing protein n=1 Tax=Kitasatospora kazusensis TaxID=407974 RepID=A0ABP4KDN9_9ACTN
MKPAEAMNHRQIMQALSGLLLGIFMAALSSTIVTNALPKILTDLHGGESAYTWVIAGTLLASCASTPLWGKLSDLVSKKLLVQISLVIYLLGSMLAGLSQNPGELIACRVLQGLGSGGITALGQVCMASLTGPRERGRYSGYFGMAFALATIGGPLIGGTIVDTSWLGWRWCFYVSVPFTLLAVVLLQKTLHLPVHRREAKIDYLGAALIASSATVLLVWITLAGDQYAWLSWQTAAMVGGSVLLGLLAVLTESRASEPIIPLSLFGYRTVTLSVLAGLLIGAAMYAATTFLSQYFQLGRGSSPITAGVETMPMVLGLAVASMVVGRLITRHGRWKVYLLIGGTLLTAGFALLGTVRSDTSYGLTACYMLMVGTGIGMTMQNLVLVIQNTAPAAVLGAASSTANFARSMGGALGVSALGAVLGHRTNHYAAQNLAAAHLPAAAARGNGSGIPDLAALPARVRPLIENAFGHSLGDVFLLTAPIAFVALIAMLLVEETPPPAPSSPAGPAGEGRDTTGPDSTCLENAGLDAVESADVPAGVPGAVPGAVR